VLNYYELCFTFKVVILQRMSRCLCLHSYEKAMIKSKGLNTPAPKRRVKMSAPIIPDVLAHTGVDHGHNKGWTTDWKWPPIHSHVPIHRTHPSKAAFEGCVDADCVTDSLPRFIATQSMEMAENGDLSSAFKCKYLVSSHSSI
jgi:hypothetical protein